MKCVKLLNYIRTSNKIRRTKCVRLNTKNHNHHSCPLEYVITKIWHWKKYNYEKRGTINNAFCLCFIHYVIELICQRKLHNFRDRSPVFGGDLMSGQFTLIVAAKLMKLQNVWFIKSDCRYCPLFSAILIPTYLSLSLSLSL